MSGMEREVADLLRAIGSTPGFRIVNSSGGRFKAIRNALPEYDIPEDSKTIYPGVGSRAYTNMIADLRRKLGWTQELHDDLEGIAAAARKKQADPTDAITRRLMDAFRPGWDAAPEPEPEPAPATPVRRHGKKTAASGGSARLKAGQAMTGGATPQLIVDHDDASGSKKTFVTPEMAFELIQDEKIAPYQRPRREAAIKRYAHDMRNGNWHPLPSDVVCFDTDGLLMNGRNRLEAVVESMCGQWFYFAYNVPPERFQYMDQGARRTSGDVLFGKGYKKNSVLTASTTRLLHVWDNVDDQDEWPLALRNVTDSDIVDALEDRPGIVDSVEHGKIGNGIAPSPSCFAHYLISLACGGDLKLPNARFAAARTGIGIQHGHPAWALREYVRNNAFKVMKHKLGSKQHYTFYQAYLILVAWNATCAGRKVAKMQPRPPYLIRDPASPGPAFLMPSI
jgi:hypothetical protein